MSDEMVPEEGWEEAFTCTASKVKLPVSEEEESMQWEEVSGADDEDGGCASRIVSKKKGKVSTGLLSSGSEGDAVESDKNSAATETIERRNAVARIADTGGRVAAVRKKHVSAKKVAAGKKVVGDEETARLEKKSVGGKKCGDPKPVFSRKFEGEKRKLAKKVVGKLEVCSGCEFEGVLESKMFKGHLLKHYANDLREEFAEALTKKECPFSDHFKSDSRDGSHCNHAMLRHIGVTHGEVIKYHLLQQQKIKENPRLKGVAEARHPQVNMEVCSVCEFEGVLKSKTFKRHLLKHFSRDLKKEFAEAVDKNHCNLCGVFKSDRKLVMVRHIGVAHGEVIKYHLKKKIQG